CAGVRITPRALSLPLISGYFRRRSLPVERRQSVKVRQPAGCPLTSETASATSTRRRSRSQARPRLRSGQASPSARTGGPRLQREVDDPAKVLPGNAGGGLHG